MDAAIMTAAQQLLGRELAGGWRVIEQLVRPLDTSGGAFSTGYIVQNQDGRRGFLKALDYSKAFTDPNIPVSIALQRLAETINHEKFVLGRCRDRNLDRIVISIADGTLDVGGPGLGTVEYFIFELADSDVRKHMGTINRLDIIWRLRCLHHVATGLQQLHSNDIVHQDVKPSNILVFNGQSQKIADLGRSSCVGQFPPHSALAFAGDRTYAPPDILFRFSFGEKRARDLSVDAYMLGSMVVYLFMDMPMTPLLLSELPPEYRDWTVFSGSVDEIQPHLASAFLRVLESLRHHVTSDLKDDICSIVSQLCEPDPSRRGHPAQREGSHQQFALNRYVTKFDLLARRAHARALGISR